MVGLHPNGFGTNPILKLFPKNPWTLLRRGRTLLLTFVFLNDPTPPGGYLLRRDDWDIGTHPSPTFETKVRLEA